MFSEWRGILNPLKSSVNQANFFLACFGSRYCVPAIGPIFWGGFIQCIIAHSFFFSASKGPNQFFWEEVLKLTIGRSRASEEKVVHDPLYRNIWDLCHTAT